MALSALRRSSPRLFRAGLPFSADSKPVARLTSNARPRWAPGSHERHHFEQRVLPFPPRELYEVVLDVDSYHEFVPWCTRSRVLARIDDKHTAAELAVGFNMLSERYTSLITAEPFSSITVDVPNSSLFDYLVNDWKFEEGPDKDSTRLSFYVEFRFRSALYQRITNQFFNAVVKNMVSAFESRAQAKHEERERSTAVAK